MADGLTIAVLPERFWRPLLAATPCRAGLPRLLGLVTAVHGRHAGLTPRLAAGILDDQSSLLSLPRRSFPPWAAVRDIVGEALGTAGQGDRFWAEVSPTLLHARALVPLLQAAERLAGRSYLFGADAAATVTGAVDYAEHQRLIERAFANLVSDRARMGAAFWDGLAFSLWSEFLLRSGSRAEPAHPRDPAPDADPGVVYWLRRLAPAFPRDMRQRRPRVVHRRVKEREPRPRQGGVAGVRLSHSPDEFGDRLISEAAWPTIVQLDRLLHSGYLVRHRPPPLDRRRDVLVAGLFAAPATIAGQSFARAAFLDAAVRTAILLRRSGLMRSDIALAARTGLDGAAAARVSIEGLDWLDAADPWTAGREARMAFLRTPGLLPQFLDRGPGEALPALPRPPHGYPPLPPPEGEWLQRAVTARAFLGTEAAALAHYDAVNVVVVASDRAAAERDRDASTSFRDLLDRVRRDLGLHGHGHSASLFLLSDAPHGTFTAVTQSRGAPAAAAGGGTAEFEGRLVARLIDSMLGAQDAA